MKRVLLALTVLLTAQPAVTRPLDPMDIAGRWRGENYSPIKCTEEACKMTFDIVACGQGWCGVVVGENDTCGTTALTLGAGSSLNGEMQYQGHLNFEPEARPYVVRVELVPHRDNGTIMLYILGASKSEFPALSRDYPFNAMLVRAGDAVCKADKPVS
jgi:hypothetical protein